VLANNTLGGWSEEEKNRRPIYRGMSGAGVEFTVPYAEKFRKIQMRWVDQEAECALDFD